MLPQDGPVQGDASEQHSFLLFIVRRRLSLRGDVGLLLVVVEGGWVGGWMVVCVMMRRVGAKKK